MTELPDISGLSAVAAADWLALRDRLATIGVHASGVGPILALCANFPEDDRNPIRHWHLRRRADPAAVAMRLLMFDDAVNVADSVAALGDRLHGLLTDAGLLRVDSDDVRCAFRLAMAENCYVLGDDLAPGGDVVMGMRDTTGPLWRAAAPARRVQRVLDIGCGAGAIALQMSPHADRVVATDINPRAVALTRINVALNGATNVEVREGDMFAPVAGETFDLIASHPPYIALPDGFPATSHLHGGPRGDEIPSRLVAGLAAHLAPGGHAVVQAHWPLREGEALVARLREIAGPTLDLLVLRLGVTGADDLATFWGERDGAAIERQRDHYAALGLLGTESTLSILRRGSTAAGWMARLDVPPGSAALVTTDRIAKLMHCCDLIHGDDADLLAARLRVPQGASIATVEGPGGRHTMLMVPPTTLRQPIDISREALQVVAAVSGVASVQESGQPLAAVRQVIAAGALEPM